jgi:hypothetical protein
MTPRPEDGARPPRRAHRSARATSRTIGTLGAVRHEAYVREIPEFVQLRKHRNDRRALPDDRAPIRECAVHLAAHDVKRIRLPVAEVRRATARKTYVALVSRLCDYYGCIALRSRLHVRIPLFGFRMAAAALPVKGEIAAVTAVAAAF